MLRGGLFFTSPFFAATLLLSAGFVFGPGRRSRGKPGTLPPYPQPAARQELSLIVGENTTRPRVEPAPEPWITMLDRGLYCGIAILGAIGTGKTRSAIRPFAWQLFCYRAHDQERRASGLVLQVKGDLCHIAPPWGELVMCLDAVGPLLF